MKIIDRIKRWYEGESVTWRVESEVMPMMGFEQRYSTSAKIARTVVQHFAKEWKWWIGTVIGVCGLLLAWQQLRQPAAERSAPDATHALHAKGQSGKVP